jgi:hypothetical protein
MPKPHISRRSRVPTGPSAGPCSRGAASPAAWSLRDCHKTGRGHGALPSRGSLPWDLLKPRLRPSCCKLIRPAATFQYSPFANFCAKTSTLAVGPRPFGFRRNPQGFRNEGRPSARGARARVGGGRRQALRSRAAVGRAPTRRGGAGVLVTRAGGPGRPPEHHRQAGGKIRSRRAFAAIACLPPHRAERGQTCRW